MKALVLLLLAAACASKQPAPQSTEVHPISQPQPVSQPQPGPQKDAEGAQKPGIDVAAIDRSVAPGDDFFSFANGSWVKNTEIPPDRSNYGAGAILVELTAKRTADLIVHAPNEGDGEKIATYYAAYMDEAGI